MANLTETDDRDASRAVMSVTDTIDSLRGEIRDSNRRDSVERLESNATGRNASGQEAIQNFFNPRKHRSRSFARKLSFAD